MYDWSFIDKIYVMTIHENAHRHSHLHGVLERIGLIGDKVEWSIRHKDQNGKKGCFEHHVDIARRAHEEGYENVLVLEDDIIETDAMTPKNLALVASFIQDQKNDDWDIFYLGYCSFIFDGRMIGKQRIQVSKNVVKERVLCMHAYIINRRCMEKIMRLQYIRKYRGQIDDVLYNDDNIQMYRIDPHLISQHCKYESSVQEGIQKTVFIQQFVQFFHKHTTVIMILLLILIIITLRFFMTKPS